MCRGEHSKVILNLPDDRIRLQVEGDLSRMRSSLTDYVATRAVLFHRIRKLAEKKKWKSVDKLMKEELPKIKDSKGYLAEINAIRVPAVKAVLKGRNRGAQRRIESLCSKTEELIKRYVNDEATIEFKAEIKSMRSIKKPLPKVFN